MRSLLPSNAAVLLAVSGAALLLGGCGGGGNAVLGPTPASSVSPVNSPPAASSAAAAGAAQPARSLVAVRAWTMPALPPSDTPTASLAALASRPADLLILDPAAVAPPSAKPDAAAKAVAALRKNGPRRVLALLDVGEIVKTNPAWVDAAGKQTPAAPTWLEAPDPEVPGASPVKYWDADWQKRATASLDALLDAGYDGVCLQGVGTFARNLPQRPTAGAEMAALVGGLAAHARKRNANFSLIVDGGALLPASLTDAQRKDFLAAIDGVLARDAFYFGDKPADNDLAPQADVLAALDALQKAKLPVFVTERLTDPAKIADFVARATSKGYLPDAAFVSATPASPPAADPKVAAADAP